MGTLSVLAVFSNEDRNKKGQRDYGRVNCYRTMPEIFEAITGDSLEPYTVKARSLYAAAVASGPKGQETQTAEWAAYEAHKKTAYAVAWGGSFKNRRRKIENLQLHSGYVLTEADEDDPEAIKNRLRHDPTVRMIYASSSGNGVHVVWEVFSKPKNNLEHRAAWAACVARMKEHDVAVLTNDDSVKDVTRLAFLAMDKAALLLEGAETVEWTPPDPDLKGEPRADTGHTQGKTRGSTGRTISDSDVKGALEHLVSVQAGKDESQLLAVGLCLRAMGWAFNDFDQWAARAGCRCDDRLGRWKSFHASDRDYGVIIGLAVKAGYRNHAGGANGRAAPGRATRQSILVCMPSQQPYPVPAILRDEVQAVHEASGGGIPMCAIAVLGAYNLLADDDFDVKALARNPHPITLFLLVSAQSGSRKSTVVELTYAGHVKADALITRAHEEAARLREAFDTSEKGKRKRKGKGQGPRRARAFVPRAMKSDFTVQAAFKLLAAGRPTQAAVMGEAGRLIGNGSWSFGKDQADKSLLDLADIWTNGVLAITRVRDDIDLRLTGRRFGMLLMAQWAKADPFLLSSAAADGFAARVLYARQDERLPKVCYQEWDGQDGADAHLDGMRDLIIAVRTGQDDGMEFAPERGGDGKPDTRKIIHFDADGLNLLKAFHVEAIARADMEVTLHEESYWVRAPELAARIAGTLAAAEYYKNHGGEPLITGAIAQQGIAQARWHGDELGRLVAGGVGAQVAGAARWVADHLDEASRNPMYGRPNPNQSGERQIKILTFISRAAAGAASHIRKDTDARRQVVSVLEEYHWVEPSHEKGWHNVLR